ELRPDRRPHRPRGRRRDPSLRLERVQLVPVPERAPSHVERRYLIVPGLRSSNIHVLDTKGNSTRPELVRTIEAAELADRAGYSRPHTVHCGPEGIYVSALGNPE